MVYTEMELKIKVSHWRYEDGVPEPIIGVMSMVDSILYPSGFRDSSPKGWYCWCYPNDNREFQDWMKTNCPRSDITFRFNSGDPMWQTFIKSKKEATIFSLKWV